MKTFRVSQSRLDSDGHAPGLTGLTTGWLAVGLSRTECLTLRPGNVQGRLAQAGEVASWAELSGPGIDAIAVLAPDVVHLFARAAASLFQDTSWETAWATILLPWRQPPTLSIRADGNAESFVCSVGVFSGLLKNAPAADGEGLCFRLLHAIMNGRVEVQRLLVRQLPFDHTVEGAVGLDQSAAVIMAHRGPKHFLTTALSSIGAADHPSPVAVRVGLDVEDLSDYGDVFERFPDVEFYRVDGAPVGPYVIRQNLIDRSNERLIVFHDSDDISCADRIALQTAEVASGQVEVVGSHELRVDEIAGAVEIYRFPLDASAALALPGSTERNDQANEPLLHPTLTMLRTGFVKAGGFSTNRKIANDTQFMLRAYFSLRMRNVDGFLYIRRRHPAALTVTKETALGTPLRHYLGTTWGTDFEAVKRGKAKLEETSLWPRHNPISRRLTRIRGSEPDFLKRPA